MSEYSSRLRTRKTAVADTPQTVEKTKKKRAATSTNWTENSFHIISPSTSSQDNAGSKNTTKSSKKTLVKETAKSARSRKILSVEELSSYTATPGTTAKGKKLLKPAMSLNDFASPLENIAEKNDTNKRPVRKPKKTPKPNMPDETATKTSENPKNKRKSTQIALMRIFKEHLNSPQRNQQLSETIEGPRNESTPKSEEHEKKQQFMKTIDAPFSETTEKGGKRSFTLENSVNDVNLLKKNAENGVETEIDLNLTDVEKLSIKQGNDTAKVSRRRLTNELENTVNDVDVLLNESKRFSCVSNNESFKKNQPVVTQLDETLDVQQLAKRLSFTLESSVNDVDLLKTTETPPKMKTSPRNKPKTEKEVLRPVSTIRKRKSSKKAVKNVEKRVEFLVNIANSSPPDFVKSSDDEKPKTPRIKRSPSLDESVIVISSDSSNCSTPKSDSTLKSPISVGKRNKIDLLKETLKKNCNLSLQSASEKKANSFRTNMPNFAKIHQKAFEKMEDIQSLSKRKEERAKVLLSGKKPTIESPQTKKIDDKSTASPKTKKKLNFPLLQENPFQFRGATPKVNRNAPEKKNNEGIQQKMALPKTPKGYTRFGFKTAVDVKANRVAQIQAVANKNRGAKETNKTERREIIKGVRSNRRFDLLMKMRNLNA